MKKRKKQPPKKPKPRLEIVDENGIFSLYKHYSRDKKSIDPILTTDNLADFIESYAEICKQYVISPDEKTIYRLINKHNKEEVNNDTSLFKGRYE